MSAWIDWLNDLGLGQFQAIEQDERAADILKQLQRFCPEVVLDSANVGLDECQLGFYEQYTLLCVALPKSDSARSGPVSIETHNALFGLYAPGDFHPLDVTGKAVRKVNELAPLKLGPDNVTQYARLRLAFEHRCTRQRREAVDDTEFVQTETIDLCRIAASAGDFNSIPLDREKLAENERDKLEEMRKEQAERPSTPGLAEDVDVHRVDDLLVTIYWVERGKDSGQTECHVCNVTASIGPAGDVNENTAKSRECSGPAESAPPHPTVFRRLRTRRAAYVETWESLDNRDRRAISETLRENYGYLCEPPGDDPRHRVLMRQCSLSFYKNFRLLEIVDRNREQYRRAYALFRIEEGKADIRLLNGEAHVIHQVNQATGELQIDESTADDYLRLFCWTIHAQREGWSCPFPIPRGSEDIAFVRSPGIETRRKLREIDYVIRPVSDDEAATKSDYKEYPSTEWIRRRAVVVYGSSVFEAWFAIHRTSGNVQMAADRPLLVNLPIDNDRYVAGDLFTLRGSAPLFVPPNATEERSGLAQTAGTTEEPTAEQNREDEEADAGQIDGPAAEEEDTAGFETVDGRTFLEELQASGEVSGKRVLDDVTLGADADRQFPDRLAVMGCVFEGGFTLRDLGEFAGEVHFKDCQFTRGIDGAGARLSGVTLIRCAVGPAEPSPTAIAVDLSIAKLQGDLTLRNCVLQGRLFAPDLRMGGSVRICGCRIDRLTTLEDVTVFFDQIDDRAMLSGFRRRVSTAAPMLCLDRAAITGDLHITHDRLGGAATASTIYGNLSTRQVSVDGNARLFGAFVWGWADFDSAQIVGELTTFAPGKRMRSSHFRCGGYMQLLDASLGRLRLSMSHIGGELSLYSATVRGTMDLLGLRVDGDLNLAFAKVHGYTTAFRRLSFQGPLYRSALTVGGDLSLSGAEIVALEWRGIEVGGSIQVKTGRFGRLCLSLGLDPLYEQGLTENYWPKPCRAAAIVMSAVTVDERLDLAGLTVELPADYIEREQLKRKIEAGVQITQCKIGSDLVFFDGNPRRSSHARWGSPNEPRWQRPSDWHGPDDAGESRDRQRAKAPNHPVPEDLRARLWGNLDLRANTIDGELDLRNVRVEGKSSLNHTSVGLDLKMGAASDPLSRPEPRVLTTCAHLDMEKIRCGGDVDLTGLHVPEAGGWPGSDMTSVNEELRGTLYARGAAVDGEILLVPRRTQREGVLAHQEEQSPSDQQGNADGSRPPIWTRVWARVRGHGSPASRQIRDRLYESTGQAWIDGHQAAPRKVVDLTAVAANHLVLSGDNAPHEDAVVSLERGQFNRLEIVEPTPGPLDLSAVRVERWVFGDRLEATAEEYIEVLRQMEPFDRSTWIGVEHSLRNQADDAGANRIYYAMRNEIYDRMLGFWGKCRDWLPWLSTAYWTRVWLPLVPWAVLLVISICVFSQDRFVRASTSLLEVVGTRQTQTEQNAQAADGPSQAPEPEPAARFSGANLSPADLGQQWGTGDGVVLAFKYHVPPAPLLVHERWEASRTKLFSWITAAHYAGFVQVFSWIAVPLWLVGLTSKVVRGRQS